MIFDKITSDMIDEAVARACAARADRDRLADACMQSPEFRENIALVCVATRTNIERDGAAYASAMTFGIEIGFALADVIRSKPA